RTSSDQVKTNAVGRPHPSRRNTYRPPAFGSDAASSAIDSAPHIVTAPPRPQTASIVSGSGTRAAMAAGVRKMPEPIVMPMTNPIELQKPRRRLSCIDGNKPMRRQAQGMLATTLQVLYGAGPGVEA